MGRTPGRPTQHVMAVEKFWGHSPFQVLDATAIEGIRGVEKFFFWGGGGEASKCQMEHRRDATGSSPGHSSAWRGIRVAVPGHTTAVRRPQHRYTC